MTLRKQLTVLGLGLLLLAAGLPVAYLSWPARTPPDVLDSAAVDSLEHLQSHTGAPADAWLGQRAALVFFGFTHCADICPATLSHISQVMDHLGGRADRLQPLFVTLDPQRDTPEQLAAYIRFFDERILGLTGTPAQLQAVVDAWGIHSRRVPVNGSYMLDHSTSLFLLGSDGQLIKRFSGQEDSDSMAGEIALLLTDVDSGSE